MSTIRDRVWMYAAVPCAYHTPYYALPPGDPPTPAEACRRLGLKRAVMDVCVKGPQYPFDEVSESLVFLDELVWTIIPSGGVTRNEDCFFDTDEVVRQIRKFPNVTGVFCDDFQYRRRSFFSPENLKEMKRRVTAAADRQIRMWMVTYNYDLFTEAAVGHLIWDYGEPVDVASFWTWQAFQLKVLREHIDYLAGKWPGKQLNVGVYLWDFSRGKPLADELMRLQLDTVLELFREGRIDSVSLCSNCIMDLGLRTEEIFRRWLDRYGDEEVGTAARAVETTVDNERL